MLRVPKSFHGWRFCYQNQAGKVGLGVELAETLKDRRRHTVREEAFFDAAVFAPGSLHPRETMLGVLICEARLGKSMTFRRLYSGSFTCPDIPKIQILQGGCPDEPSEAAGKSSDTLQPISRSYIRGAPQRAPKDLTPGMLCRPVQNPTWECPKKDGHLIWTQQDRIPHIRTPKHATQLETPIHFLETLNLPYINPKRRPKALLKDTQFTETADSWKLPHRPLAAGIGSR